MSDTWTTLDREVRTYISAGKPIDFANIDNCQEIIDCLQKNAATWIDQNQDVYAQIALTEAQRLWQEFPPSPLFPPHPS